MNGACALIDHQCKDGKIEEAIDVFRKLMPNESSERAILFRIIKEYKDYLYKSVLSEYKDEEIQELEEQIQELENDKEELEEQIQELENKNKKLQEENDRLRPFYLRWRSIHR